MQPRGHRPAAARSSKIDGSRKNPVTDGYICAKVRRFGERVYGPDRLLYPAVRSGRKGAGEFKRVTWDEAIELIATRFEQAKATSGAESILPYSYGGSNGLLTQDNLDAQLWRRFGTSRLARTVCAAPTGAANMALYGKMPSVTYQDYPEAKLIILWGVNPSASGIHLIPYVREAQKRGAKLVVDRSAHDRAGAQRRPASRGQDRAPTSPSRWRSIAICSRTGTPTRRSCASTRPAPSSCRSAPSRGRSSARPRSPASTRRQLEALAKLYAESSPALIRCGWGLERNRNGGNAAMAVLALPAVGGKFGVRGGGYSMSNSASWNIERTWIDAPEPATRIVNMNHLGRALTEYDDPPVNVLFVYNCNPAATVPDQRRVIKRPRARGSLHRRLRAGDDRHGALRRRGAAEHDVPRGLRFREGLRPDQPRPRPAGDRRGRRGAHQRRRVRRAVRAARRAARTTSRRASWT